MHRYMPPPASCPPMTSLPPTVRESRIEDEDWQAAINLLNQQIRWMRAAGMIPPPATGDVHCPDFYQPVPLYVQDRAEPAGYVNVTPVPGSQGAGGGQTEIAGTALGDSLRQPPADYGIWMETETIGAWWPRCRLRGVTLTIGPACVGRVTGRLMLGTVRAAWRFRAWFRCVRCGFNSDSR